MNKVLVNTVIAGMVMGLFSGSSQGGQITVHSCEDVFINTAGGGDGHNSFLKFDISPVPAGRTIDSVFLDIYVWQVNGPWTGNVDFWNVNDQNWTEVTPQGVLWGFSTSDLVSQVAGFGTAVDWTRSADIKPIFLRDYDATNTYCSIKMKDPDDVTFVPIRRTDSDTLILGNPVDEASIYLYPHEHGGGFAPRLIVYSSEFSGLPDIEVSDTLYDFGIVTLGDSSNWTDLWIRNLGDTTLEILGIIPSNTEFSIVSPSFPTTIDTLDSLAVAVRFVPTDTVVYIDSLTIHSNDPDEPAVIVQVLGEGELGGPDIEVSDTLHDFGLVTIGDSSNWTDLWIKNVGDSALEVSDIIPSSAEFSIVSPSFPATIDTLDSLSITVRFKPTDTVVYTDSLTIHSNDADEPQVAVYVSGEGRARTPDIEVSDTLYDFGMVIVGDSSDWTDLWIRNVGDSALKILGIIPSTAEFSIVSPSFPTTIDCLDSLAVTVRFIPTDTVVHTGHLDIHSNDPDEPQVQVHLSGEGWAGGPKIELSDTLHDFGVVIVGDSSDWTDLWIRNVGDSTLQVTGIIPDEAAFSVVSPSCPTTVSPFDSLAVTVRFRPTDTTAYSGRLTVHSNDPDKPQVKVHLSGEGWAGGPRIEISDTLYDFGAVVVGSSTDWTDLWIKNVGDSALQVLGIIPSNGVFSIVSPSFPATVGSLDSLVVTVQFVPADTILYTGDLAVHSDDPIKPQVQVHVSGKGTSLGIEGSRHAKLVLLRSSPNPFTRLTTIRYQILAPGKVCLRVYNIAGGEIRTLVDEFRAAGVHTTGWNGRDNFGKPVSSGLYFYRLETSGSRTVRTFIRM